MADDLPDNGVVEVLVLPEDAATLATDRLVVAGGGHADVFADDGQVLVQVAAGHPDGLELVRAVLAAPDLHVHGAVLDVVVVCSRGYDRYVLSGDLEHRWLFTRHWDRRPGAAATVAVVGHSPPDRETSPGGSAPRARLADAVQLLEREVGSPRTMHAVNLFTRRAAGPDDVTGAPTDRRPDPGVVTDALAEADAVLAAWGPVPGAGLDAVDDTVELLRARRDDGARVLVAASSGTTATSGTPPQPTDDLGQHATRLVDAPAEWLWGGPLVD